MSCFHCPVWCLDAVLYYCVFEICEVKSVLKLLCFERVIDKTRIVKRIVRIQFNSIQFKSLFIRSKDKNTYLMLQVNIKNTLVKFTSYE